MNIQSTSKKSFKPMLFLSLFVVFVISTTTAYFTGSAQSDDNIFMSGDLEVGIIQNNLFTVQDWFPGSEHTIEFSIVNNGNINQYVKGYLGGTWDNEVLDNSVFEITKLERSINDEWITMNIANMLIGDEFYLSTDGSSNSLIELSPGTQEDFRLSVKLSELTGDEYQNESFVANLHLAARQTIEGADWPSNY